jgi:hypothetical protein
VQVDIDDGMMIHQFMKEEAASAAGEDEKMANLLCLLQLQASEES